MQVGWARFRVAGRADDHARRRSGRSRTAGLMALAAHALFGFDWTTAGILGAALAPTDPAVMFSVLGKREIGGRTGTILEGESGRERPGRDRADDRDARLRHARPRDASGRSCASSRSRCRSGWRSASPVRIARACRCCGDLAAERGALPAADARDRRRDLRRRRRRPRLGLPRGLRRRPAARLGATRRTSGEIERFHTSLASLAEIVVFVALGLTIDLGEPRRAAGLAGRDPARADPRARRPAARVRAAPPRRPGCGRGERVFVALGRAEGRRADPARRVRGDRRRRRRAADLRPRLRGRALLGGRAGDVAAVRRRAGSACRCASASPSASRI